MNRNRIVEHPILGRLEKKAAVPFTFDGQAYEGYDGDTIASALLANDVRTLRVHEESGTSRGVYCNIGHCFECRVTVNQTSGVRACMTPLQAEMVIESGKIQPAPLKPTANAEERPRTYAEFAKKQGRAEKEEPDV